jgi:hypothetical protein
MVYFPTPTTVSSKTAKADGWSAALTAVAIVARSSDPRSRQQPSKRLPSESLGGAGGLQTAARPRRSTDGRPMPTWAALLTLFAAAMNGGEIYRALSKSGGCLMGTDLAGRGRGAPAIGAEKAKRRKRNPAARKADRMAAHRHARLPGGRSSISGRSCGLRRCPPRRRFEADRSVSALNSGLGRRFAFGGTERIS